MKKQIITFIFLLFVGATFAQTSSSLFWKVSGNGLKKPSYLFGTFHLLSNSFADSLPIVMKSFQEADAIVGELLIDSNMQAPMMAASMLQGTTLKELLPDSVFQKVDAWFQKEAGMPLEQLNVLNPTAVTAIAMLITQQKYLPNPEGEIALDAYFQERGKAEGKEVLGLETIHDQVKALFGSVSLERQVEIMTETFYDPKPAQEYLFTMNKAYRQADFKGLEEMMYTSTYKPEELKILLDDRNFAWADQLPGLMKDKSLFIAVGALHLSGANGLVSLLRNLGYEVTPLIPKDSE
ncbi:MAG: TraB/GumN family protein [Bacteroidales bacterium]|nr:TraB/GumN family protein [Bacteroidales bacterium]